MLAMRRGAARAPDPPGKSPAEHSPGSAPADPCDPKEAPSSAHAPEDAAVPAEALSAAAQWLALLTAAAARAPLPPQGLALLADLAQLLFYCAGPAAGAGPNLAAVRLPLAACARACGG